MAHNPPLPRRNTTGESSVEQSSSGMPSVGNQAGAGRNPLENVGFTDGTRAGAPVERCAARRDMRLDSIAKTTLRIEQPRVSGGRGTLPESVGVIVAGIFR